MERRSDVAALAAGALAGLALVTAAGLLAGYDLSETLGGTNSERLAHYVLASGVLGAVAAVAWRRGLRVAPPLGSAAVLVGVATRPTGELPSSLASLNTGLTGSLVVLVLAAAAEYVLRNPDAARSVVTPRARNAGMAAGFVHVLVVLALRPWLGLSTAYVHVPANAAITLWSLAGVFLVAFGATVAAVRFGLVTPPAVVALAFAWAVRETWLIRASLRDGAAIAGAGLDLYGWLWFVPLGLALWAGFVEFGLRRYLRGGSVPGTA